jgi:2,3,4,5-tetrahydropyridine-2-carboxylate N-succinyltransferase
VPAGRLGTVSTVTDANFETTGAWGVGLATFDADGRVLDTWYPRVSRADDLSESPVGLGEPGTHVIGPEITTHALSVDAAAVIGPDERRGVRVEAVVTVIESMAKPPADTHDVWLRLHLLSHRLVRPREVNLDGLFGLLNNVAWTNAGPVPVDQVEQVRLRFRSEGSPLQVSGVDKFPRMTDYVVPSGVRIADADRVRLGAHLAPGTTVMHPGFVNFNAGTLGTCMIEGRITAGSIVGDGSDIGAGSSLMGTLSGGGTHMITIGERCLVGANGGTGISLGDECTVEAGLYLTRGTVVTLPDGTTAKAQQLSGQPGLLYRRNSRTGTVEAIAHKGSWGGLNESLHRN